MGGWKKARKYDSVCYIVYRHVAPREAQENIPIINFGACALVGFAVRIQMQGGRNLGECSRKWRWLQARVSVEKDPRSDELCTMSCGSLRAGENMLSGKF